MTDIFTKEKRSEIMSKIKSKGTKIELRMMNALETNDLKFECQPKIFGKPDFLVHPNIVVFCDSSFWHGRDWKNLKPQLKEGYWQEHIKKNRKRDRAVNTQLKKKGYVVLRFWDDQIDKRIERCIKRIETAVSSTSKSHAQTSSESRNSLGNTNSLNQSARVGPHPSLPAKRHCH
jgi:DNA mismatch endonuclease (patch repair protein)